MLRNMCKGKIHRATVTEARLDYVGSITLDSLLMKAANIEPQEIVQITSLRNATRWITYAIAAPEGSGKVCLNGPPALLFEPGDLIIVLSMGLFNEEELIHLRPQVVYVDGANRIENVEELDLAIQRQDRNLEHHSE
ncbi:L-aspartate 1-decarboxylase [Paenibacillaceae bacterium GAS479]|nr:L-aspartate 1-decarboxylase [Paenibacillaceae bacterium GAS479]